MNPDVEALVARTLSDMVAGLHAQIEQTNGQTTPALLERLLAPAIQDMIRQVERGARMEWYEEHLSRFQTAVHIAFKDTSWM